LRAELTGGARHTRHAAIKAIKAERARAAMTRLSNAAIATAAPANQQPDLPRRPSGDLDQIRNALYPDQPETTGDGGVEGGPDGRWVAGARDRGQEAK
jgi:hypothetical protein